MNVQTVKKYGIEIVKAAGYEFTQNVQVEAAIDITPTRLLQESPKADVNDKINPTIPDALLDDRRIEDQSKPIRYRRNNTNNVRVKVTNEANINCSLYCTGPKTRRACDQNLFKDNKCGYQTGLLTGNEKKRGMVYIKYNPEGAKAAREKRQKNKEQRKQRKQQEKANNEAKSSATPSKNVDQGNK